MSLPTTEELAGIYIDQFDLACNTTPGTSLAAMSEEEEDQHCDASRETALAAVRDAVLDGLIAEAQSRVLLFATWGGSESKDPPPAMALADWLRSMKGTP